MCRCFSEEVGVKGGEQVINFGLDSCWKPGIIIHELMHTVGFLHEQARNGLASPPLPLLSSSSSSSHDSVPL